MQRVVSGDEVLQADQVSDLSRSLPSQSAPGPACGTGEVSVCLSWQLTLLLICKMSQICWGVTNLGMRPEKHDEQLNTHFGG